MNTSALLLMLMTQILVIAATGYFLYKVLFGATNKSSKDNQL